MSSSEPPLAALIGPDSVLAALAEPSAVVDGQATLLCANAALSALLAAHGGEPWAGTARGASELRQGIAAVCSGAHEQVELELELELDGSAAPRRLLARVVCLRREPPRLALLSLLDTADRAELEGLRAESDELRQQLIQAQKLEAVGRLTGGVAHDFNNMLTSIICFTRFVVDDMAAEDPRRSDLIEVLKSADNAARLTNQLLAFSRRKPFMAVHINVNDAVTSVGRVLRRTLGEHIELVIEPSDEPLYVLLDPGQFDQLLFNLAILAKDALSDGGTIAIRMAKTRLQEKGDQAELMIVQAARAGTPAREPAPPGGPSSGLGLAMCRAIAEQAHGALEAHVSAAGEGFRVLLPACEEPRRGDNARRISLAPVALSGTVLVVEDQPAILRTMVRALSSTGLRVLEAGSGEDALAVLEERSQLQPELVVTDVVLPRMSGPHLVERLRERNPALKALYVSGYVGDELAGSVRTDDNTAFVLKPFTGRQLAVRAAALLAQRTSG